MDLWSVRFEIQDNFKNIFSEYVEDFPNYISSSLFANKENDKKKAENHSNHRDNYQPLDEIILTSFQFQR